MPCFPVGSTLTKDFPGHGEFHGVIVSYDEHSKHYRVHYNDGDEEDLSENEVEELTRVKAKKRANRKNPPTILLESSDSEFEFEEPPKRTKFRRLSKFKGPPQIVKPKTKSGDCREEETVASTRETSSKKRGKERDPADKKTKKAKRGERSEQANGFVPSEDVEAPEVTPKARRRTFKGRKQRHKTDESALCLFTGSVAKCEPNVKKKSESTKEEFNFKVGPQKGAWKKQSWDETFAELVAYQKEHGHCDVTTRENPRLGSWVTIQKGRNKDKLTASQIQKLNSLGFCWEKSGAKFDKKWDNKFNELLEYKRQHRLEIAHVPLNRSDDEKTKSLANWCACQRWKYSKKTLRQDRQQRLEDIGFPWVIDESKQWKSDRDVSKWSNEWEDMFGLLVSFREQHGHCLVPWNHYKGKKGDEDIWYSLGRWVRAQRSQLLENRLDPLRKQRLDGLNFVWRVDTESADDSLHQRQWDTLFDRLAAFKSRTGHTLVPMGYEDKELANWVSRQRYFHHNGSLPTKRAKRLKQIGFWFGRNQKEVTAENHEHYNLMWNESFDKLIAFQLQTGHTRVPRDYADDLHLGHWADAQRQRKAKGTLLEDRKRRLDGLGFEWTI